MSDKFEFIDAEYAANHRERRNRAVDRQDVRWLMEVSRSGFYEWRDRPASATAERREELKLFITQVVRGLRRHLRVPPGPRRPGRLGRRLRPGARPVPSCVSWAWSPASPGPGGLA